MPTLGLSMIVRNEAHTLRSCLNSVQGLVSQIVIADTGSTDNSPEIAREYGAHVISVPWENDYAKARNAALIPMKTDWILVLDADEELDAEAKHLVPELMAAPDISGYITVIRDYMPGTSSYYLDQHSKRNDSRLERAKGAASYHDQQTIRLFRNHPEIYYFGRVHELVEYRICKLGLKYVPCNIVIHHFGHLRGADVREKKHLFYRELGRLKIKEQPDNPFAFFELGILEYQAFRNYDTALQCFRETVRLFPKFIRAWLFMAMIQLDLHQPAEAMATIERAEGTEEAAGLRERLKGDAFTELGKAPEARVAYENALRYGGADPNIESKLGYAEVRLGEHTSGIQKLERAVAVLQHSAEAHDRLVKAYVIAGNLEGAAEAAERFAGSIAHPKTFLRAASIRAQLQQWDRAEKSLARGLQLFPQSQELLRAHEEVEMQNAVLKRSQTPVGPNAISHGVPTCQP